MPRIRFCVIVLINLAMVNSFGLINIDNVGEEELVDKLVNAINNKEQDVEAHNRINVRSTRKNVDGHENFERVKLIKTKLPVGEHVSFKTDGKSMYKVLMRIQKRKKPIYIRDNDEYVVAKLNPANKDEEQDFKHLRHKDQSKIKAIFIVDNDQYKVFEKTRAVESTDSKRDGVFDKNHEKLNRTKPKGFAAFWQKVKTLKDKYKKEKAKTKRSFDSDSEDTHNKTEEDDEDLYKVWDEFKKEADKQLTDDQKADLREFQTWIVEELSHLSTKFNELITTMAEFGNDAKVDDENDSDVKMDDENESTSMSD